MFEFDTACVDEAKRGFIYRFNDGKTETVKYALVVGANDRRMDKFISIIMLGNVTHGHDVVMLSEEVDGMNCVHCGMITYCPRSYLTECVGNVSDEDMSFISKCVMSELGIEDTAVIERDTYKAMYIELLNKVMEGNDGN